MKKIWAVKLIFLSCFIFFLFSPSLSAIVTAPPAEYHIKDNAVGGDCPLIGTWDTPTKTCTLTQNISNYVYIDNDDITVDGARHLVQSTINIISVNNISIKNTIFGVGGFIYISSSSGTKISQNTFFSTGGSVIFLGNTADVKIYNNDFLGRINSEYYIVDTNTQPHTISQGLPIGGNFYQYFNLANSTDAPYTCTDINADDVCDSSYSRGSFSDEFPWTSPEGWENYVPTSSGFSSVLFIPGLEGSRLYTQKNILGIHIEDQLWEPNFITDVEDLYLNTDGTSKKTNIYTWDIIKESNIPVSTGLLGFNIYKSFSNTMDGLVSRGEIASWKAFPYDWRMSPVDVVNTPQKYTASGNTASIIQALESLVATSKNGKVTIIAHSTGGLVAKALLVKLEQLKNAGTSNLLDKIDLLVLVASPQIGTASAVPAVLHGFGQSIGGGIILDQTHARELGRNMPGAYALLPSREYINHVSASPISFTDNLPIPSGVTTDFISRYGNVIDSYSEYTSFLSGAEGRAQPGILDTLSPLKLSSTLFSIAENMHNTLDTWTPPPTLRVVEVAGWGLDTVAGFEYYPKLTGCNSSNTGAGCTNPYTLDERPIWTSDGDNTVIEPSAHYGVGEKVWVDLFRFNALKPILKTTHKDILEVEELRDYISSLILNKPTSYNLILTNKQPLETSNRLRVSIHSPVSISAYDKDGNFTGKVCPPTADFCYAQQDIPNSSYVEFGEGKYVNLPEDSMQKIVLQGTDTGTFTYESEKVLPSGQSTTTVFMSIPVTSQTTAEITLNPVTQNPELALDVNSDGIIDFNILPKNDFDPILFLQVMRKTVESFDIRKVQKENLYKRIDDTIKAIQKSKIGKAKLTIEMFKKTLSFRTAFKRPRYDKDNNGRWCKIKPAPLTSLEANLLISLLNQLLDNLNK